MAHDSLDTNRCRTLSPLSHYGHPPEDLAREPLKRAYATNVVRLQVGEVGLTEEARGG